MLQISRELFYTISQKLNISPLNYSQINVIESISNYLGDFSYIIPINLYSLNNHLDYSPQNQL